MIMKDRSNVSGTIKQILPFTPSTLETIDYAVYNWLKEKMDIFCTTNKGRVEVPIVWVAGERSWQIKDHKDLRDIDGALIFPIITLQRNSVTKNPENKGVYFANIPPVRDNKGGSITIARRINADKTANFLNADTHRRKGTVVKNAGNPGNQQINFPDRRKAKKKKIVYETITIPLPVYIESQYEISIRTEYQQQMNEALQPFITTPNGINYVPLKKDGHFYEGFMDAEFGVDNNITAMEDETRIYETNIGLRVLGYLIGQDDNGDQPHIVKRENAVKVEITRERVMLGDEPDWLEGEYLP